MKFGFINKRKEFLPKALLYAAVIFGICILMDIGWLVIESVVLGKQIETVIGQNETDPNEAERYFQKFRTLADELKENNLFAPKPPKQHPVKKVAGILGDEVLISGKWYKVGDSVGDANIVAIEPTQVKILWQGNEKYFAPMAAALSADSKPANGNKKAAKKIKKKKVVSGSEKAEEVVAAAVSQDDPLAWLGSYLPAHLRAKFLEKWNSLSDEQKAEAKQQWNDMSDEQKQQAADAWEQHF
ncbi:MAG: DUF3106 domain-containing protein [Anaerohalosphaeraceae bacterium]|nr:DUF3106 domain-containing protein [Anaerohalosphaeraceae bacterium]